MSGLWVILLRELAEMRRSPLLILSMASLPATMVGVPLILVWYLVGTAREYAVVFIQELYGISAAGPTEAIVEATARNWLPIFLIMPVFLPILIAAQSIGGERERRTLEPLLATPVSTLEIILAKSIAAVFPALIITWIAAIVFMGGLDWLAIHHGSSVLLPNTHWLVGLFVLSPLLALFGNTLAVVVSSRVQDPRAAQNLAAMSVVPLVGLVVAQIMGRVGLDLGFYLGFALALAAADTVLVALAVSLFDRERLLTRWR